MNKFYSNKVISTYFILQPFIDIITGLMKYYFSLSISLAMIIRFLFIIYAGIYILKNRNKKINIFILLWFLYCVINIVGNYYIKDSFNILHQCYNLFRMLYFQVALLFFYLYFKKHKNIDNKIFTYMGVCVGLSLIISLISKTSFCSYDEFDNCFIKGYLGYFYSANEYGSILIALLGIQIIEFIKNHKLINYITLFLLIFYLCILGTKTSYIGLIGLLGGTLIYYLIMLIRKKEIYIKYIKHISVILLSFVVVIIITPKLPVYYNVVTIYKETISTETTNQETENLTKEELSLIESKAKNNVVFNGRTDFVNTNKQIYKEAPLFNKLFGITDQGNYLNGISINHINERDFHDLYMIYGIVGLILELLLPCSIIYVIIKSIIKNIKIIYDIDNIILFGTFLLLILVGYMAGHSLFHPGVSFYIAYIFINLYKSIRRHT